jgi:hypothetical protein
VFTARSSAARKEDFMKLIMLSVLPVLLAACAPNAGAGPVEGPVRLGQTVAVGGPKVRPVKLVEDSRCPMNARCVWAGRVVVRAIVITGRGARSMDLTFGKPVQVADGELTLTSVTPDRMAGGPRLRPIDYRFGFEFQGGL